MPTHFIIVKGKVQGVFYRATAKSIAKELNINGWIKNNAVGDVECLVTGSEICLNEFITWCRKGPANAEVSEVIVEEKDEVLFEKFSIVR
ncbi:MAG: acylphosphatase [Chitinophagaceae bacterium]